MGGLEDARGGAVRRGRRAGPKPVVNPRLTDAFGLVLSQSDVDFAIPHLREDIPLHIDPFLLWRSDDKTYRDLHSALLAFFERLRLLALGGHRNDALRSLLICSEPREFGLGYALGTKRGSAIGAGLAQDVVALYSRVPQLGDSGFSHIEEMQLLVPGLAEDRISDLAAVILKGFFIHFTAQRAAQHCIPAEQFVIPNVYDHERAIWRASVTARLPYNPLDGSPLFFVPLDILRHLPWINYEDYYRSYYAPYVLPADRVVGKIAKARVLAYNRQNYVAVQRYVHEKERTGSQCVPDPLFQPLKLATLRAKFEKLRAIPTGREERHDKEYEDLVCDLLSSLLYDELELAASQVRTLSGVHIRDLIFCNDGKTSFLDDMRTRFDARQIVFELKNVRSLSGEHVDQLYRYMDAEIGRFGFLVTRNPTPQAVLRNTVDLHSSKRCIVLCLSDIDIDLMINMLASGRRPVEVLKKKYVEFTRLLPK